MKSSIYAGLLLAALFISPFARSQNQTLPQNQALHDQPGTLNRAETCFNQAEHEELQRLRKIVETLANELGLSGELAQELLESEGCHSNGFVDNLGIYLPESQVFSEPYVPGDLASENRAIVDFLNSINYIGLQPLCSGTCPEDGQVCSPTHISSSSLDDFTLYTEEVVGQSRYLLRENKPGKSEYLRLTAECNCLVGGLTEH